MSGAGVRLTRAAKRKASDIQAPTSAAAAAAAAASSVVVPEPASSSSSDLHVQRQIQQLLDDAGVKSDGTQTKAGWCLRQGLIHVGSLDHAKLLPRICHHGVPTFYKLLSADQEGGAKQCRHEATQDLKDPETCFQSLCRIVVGQFVSGKAAQAAWQKLNAFLPRQQKLTPKAILAVTKTATKLETFQKSVGVTKGKAKSIVDLAQHFHDETLTEDMLQNSSEETVRTALLKVTGIGPWSVDMFLMFYLERGNVLPLGDLGVRKGMTQHFFSNGNNNNGNNSRKLKLVCPKKDAAKISQRLQPYEPYWSLVAYYMWRVADTPTIPEPEDSNDDKKQATSTETASDDTEDSIQDVSSISTTPSTPATKAQAASSRKKARTVTP